MNCRSGGCSQRPPTPPTTALQTWEVTNSEMWGSSLFLLEEEWDFALLILNLTHVKHPVSSFPFSFSAFRIGQVSKLGDGEIPISSCWRATSQLHAGGKREGFPGFYWTIGEWLPLLCWVGLKNWTACSYFCNVDFNPEVSCRMKEVLCKVVLKNNSDVVKLTPTLPKNKLALVIITILKNKSCDHSFESPITGPLWKNTIKMLYRL